jgi:hypothetical protein
MLLVIMKKDPSAHLRGKQREHRRKGRTDERVTRKRRHSKGLMYVAAKNVNEHVQM